MQTLVLVHISVQGRTRLVGRLWAHSHGAQESATFEYDRSWLARPERFSLEPALPAGPGPFHTVAGRPLFGAIGDSAPDRWGRMLMRRAERRRAELAHSAPRALREIDYLLLVNDEARQGALRFAHEEGGPFLAGEGVARIPPLVELPKLLSASERVLGDSNSDDDLRLLLAPGSSLGGARPKASVQDRDGRLAIAKFPSQGDEVDAVRWEAVALSLAGAAGVRTPDWRLATANRKPVLLMRRFDRSEKGRVPFLSAMSMLGAKDNEMRSYMEIADALRQYGAAPKLDMHELWRRIVFSILISNTDDHLRNHGFLYAGSAAWRLSPAYDLNPVPPDVKPRVLSTAIDLDGGEASLERALAVSEYFELSLEGARRIAAEVGKAVAQWRRAATRLGLTKAHVDRMAAAFEHRDLQAARSFVLSRRPMRR
jgi:serine/threonine-protein kinase HipA